MWHTLLIAALALSAALCATLPARAQIAPSASDIRAYSGLHAAAAKGDAAEIARLLAAGGQNIDAKDDHSRTPLIVAAHFGHRDAARALVKGGANPNALDAQKYDIITIASVNDDVPMLKVALELGCDPKNITSPYHGTALIAAKAPLDHVNNLHWTALIESIVLGNGGKRHTDTLEALVKAGANLQLADRAGVTPLALAKARGYTAMVKILEAAGAK